MEERLQTISHTWHVLNLHFICIFQLFSQKPERHYECVNWVDVKERYCFPKISSNGVSIKSSVNILTFKKELMCILNYTFRNQK